MPDPDLQILLKLARFIATNRAHPMPSESRQCLSAQLVEVAATMSSRERRILVAEFEHELAACALLPTPVSPPLIH
jgi:hypothetical protein